MLFWLCAWMGQNQIRTIARKLKKTPETHAKPGVNSKWNLTWKFKNHSMKSCRWLDVWLFFPTTLALTACKYVGNINTDFCYWSQDFGCLKSSDKQYLPSDFSLTLYHKCRLDGGYPCCLYESQKANELLWPTALFLPRGAFCVLIWFASSVFLSSLSRLSVCFDLCILSHFYM